MKLLCLTLLALPALAAAQSPRQPFSLDFAWDLSTNQPVVLGSYTVTRSLVFDRTWSANLAAFGGSTLGKGGSLLGGPGFFLSKSLGASCFASAGITIAFSAGDTPNVVGFVGLTGFL
jgi:hypothetical protein